MQQPIFLPAKRKFMLDPSYKGIRIRKAYASLPPSTVTVTRVFLDEVALSLIAKRLTHQSIGFICHFNP
jgi:hypothetical protein